MGHPDKNIYVSKPKQEHFETFCLNELKHEMKIYTEGELEKMGKSHVKVETFTDYYLEKFWIHSDRQCLKQILSILLDNAVKHTDRGAILFDFQISSFTQFRDMVSFFVDDTGSGIYHKNDLNYLIAEGLVKKLGGEMKITPSDDAGITVQFNVVCAPFDFNEN